MYHPGPYKRIFILSLFVSISLTACSGGGTPIKYYMIDPVRSTGPSGDSSNQLSIEIMDVNVPQYLERFNLVTRGNENQLFLSEFHQWGDNFRKNLLRTMARNISVKLGTNDIGTPINRMMSVPDYRIQVHIEQFERNYDGRVVLVGRWQVRKLGPDTVPVTHEAKLSSTIMFAMDDYDNIVNDMRNLFGEFSDLIADSILAGDAP